MKPQIIKFEDATVRSVNTWTPPLVRSALSALFMGRWAQAGQLIDSMLGYGRIQSVLGVRSRALQAMELMWEGKSTNVLKALDTDFWRFFPEDSLQELQIYGWCAGAVLVELDWTDFEGRWVPTLKTWHPSLQRYDMEKREWYVKLQSGQEMLVTPGDGKWVLFSPGGRRRPWVSALVRTLSIPFVAATYGVSDWGGYNEIHGQPMRVGVGASSAPERDAMAADLAALGKDTSIALPPGYDVKLLEATAATWKSFADMIEWANLEISITVLGQNLTTQVSGASLAAAQVHNQIRMDIIESDAEYMATFLHEQVLPWYVDVNFGGSEVPWPRWNTTPPADEKTLSDAQLARANALGALGDAITKLAGVAPVDVTALLDAMQVPVTGRIPKSGMKPTPATGRLIALMGSNLSPIARGQLYTDHVVREALNEAGEATVGLVLQALEQTSDADTFLARLGMIAAAGQPGEHAEVLQAASLATHLAGRLAVLEDL